MVDMWKAVVAEDIEAEKERTDEINQIAMNLNVSGMEHNVFVKVAIFPGLHACETKKNAEFSFEAAQLPPRIQSR